MAKTISKKKSEVGVLTLPDFMTFYKTTIIETVSYLRVDNRSIGQN